MVKTVHCSTLLDSFNYLWEIAKSSFLALFNNCKLDYTHEYVKENVSFISFSHLFIGHLISTQFTTRISKYSQNFQMLLQNQKRREISFNLSNSQSITEIKNWLECALPHLPLSTCFQSLANIYIRNNRTMITQPFPIIKMTFLNSVDFPFPSICHTSKNMIDST